MTSTRMHGPVFALVALALAACGSTRDEASDSSDSGVEDAGASPDAGSPVDAAPADAAPPVVCGTRGAAPCPSGTFCYREGSCGEADEGGACVVTPAACPKDLAPVCGCDGLTYGNACEAQRARVSVRASGRCPASDAGVPPRDAGGSIGASCGGFAGIPCDPGLFCLEPEGQCRTVSDGMGTCEARPGACPSNYSPVCGCDGRTYSNECVARAAGQSVARTGACP